MQIQTMLLGSNKDCRAIETSTSHYRNTSPCSSKYITSIHGFNIKFPQHHITSPSSLPQQKISQKSPHCVAGLLVSRCSCAVVFLSVCVGLAVDHTGVASATLLGLVWQGGGEGAKRCK